MKTLPQRTTEEESARTCAYIKCEMSLAYEPHNKKWCEAHAYIGRTELSKANRQARKLLKQPTGYRTDLSASMELTDSMTILYEDYKEPLKTVAEATGEGFGYMGTVAMSADREYVQCHICGNLYRALSGHIGGEHKTTMAEYKKAFGLSVSTVLIGDSLRYERQQAILEKNTKKVQPAHLKAYVARLKSGEQTISRGDHSLEWRNKRGLCPDQVLEKIIDLQEKLGYMPSYEDFRIEYKGRFMHSIQYLHGSWSEAVRKVGGKTREDLRRHSQEDLIEELQAFQQRYDRIPMTSDFNRGLLTNKGTFIRKFGTLNNARISAGMNAIVPLGGKFGNYKEITAEEYEAYQAGHGRSANAIRMKQRREARKLVNNLMEIL